MLRNRGGAAAPPYRCFGWGRVAVLRNRGGAAAPPYHFCGGAAAPPYHFCGGAAAPPYHFPRRRGSAALPLNAKNKKPALAARAGMNET